MAFLTSACRKASKYLKVAKTLALNVAFHPLARVSRRDPRRWLFGHKGDVFAGNPKYLFLWISLHRPDIEAIWITGNAEIYRLLRDNGYRVERRWSLRGIAAALSSSAFVFSHDVVDVNAPASRGAVHLNLWHGLGLKTLHVRRKQAGLLVTKLLDFLYPPHDIVIATSDRMVDYFSGQFGIPPQSCPKLGYPRLDAAFDDRLSAASRAIDESLGFTLKPAGFAEVYFYAPTFRDTGRPFIAQAFPDMARLSRALTARKALLYIKPHEQTAEPFPAGHFNISPWPDEIDFNSYLGDFDILITDYSSVIYDYLLLHEIGVIVYSFDYAEYISKDRQFVQPFEENIAGLRVSSFDELCEALERGSAFDPELKEAAQRVRHRYWDGSATPASPAIVRYAERLIGERTVPLRRDS